MKLENRKGEKNGMARLTAQSVRAIRKQAAQGATLAALGQKYGVSHVAIHYVVTRKTWRHVDEKSEKGLAETDSKAEG